jgi:ARG and Rhodanese-Phosphatase-superfamily-associated Protein domain
MECDGLVVVALSASSNSTDPAYLTLDEATGTGAVDIHELGSGAVPTVAVETKGQPVVIFGGDTIVGGKQNRIVNVTIWLTAMQTTQIPVTCLEHGRWDPGAEMRFASGPRADLRLRSMLNSQVHAQARATTDGGSWAPAELRYAADQGRVWDEVAMKQERASSSSRTDALHDLYAREAQDVEALQGAFPYPDGATGAAIGIGGRLVALELYDTPTTARKLWRRVIEGAVRAHLDHRRLVAVGGMPAPRHRYPDRDALGRMLGRVKAAQTDTLESPAVGEGTDVRFETDRITGAALIREGHVVHAEVHRVA